MTFDRQPTGDPPRPPAVDRPIVGMYLTDRQYLIPGAKEVVEVDGAKVFFPEERPGDLVPELDRHWGR